MCGIIGYLGGKNTQTVLIDGLKKLEYRGYDSAGIALLGQDGITVTKSPGKISELEKKVAGSKYQVARVGIAHTRWATHGPPTADNAHPHTDCTGRFALVHNGIVENYQELRNELKAENHKFNSETDTEVLVHLVEKYYDGDLEEAVRKTLQRVRGTYGVAVIAKDEPDKIVAARLGSPLVLGMGDGEFFIASDTSAILAHTRQVVYLDDGEMAVVTPSGYEIRTLENAPVSKDVEQVEWEAEDVQKDGHPHFMMKEMIEQPEVIINSTRGRLDFEEGLAVLGGLRDAARELRRINRFIIVGCGSAYYAGLVGEYMIEEYAGIPVEVEVASEFRYRKPLIDRNTAVLAISQSGETADTLAAIREAEMKGALTLGIVNSVGSTIARETEAGVYNHAGPEIGVASTKAFVSQVVTLALFTLFLGRQRQMSLVMGKRIAEEIERLPDKIQTILDKKDEIKKIADRYVSANNFLYLGRKYCNPIAHEGALKLKEISYIHANGYASGEMKHGPIALIDPDFPTLIIAPQDSVYEKTKSNLEEIKARRGPVIGLTTEGNNELEQFCNDVIYIPKTLEMLTPILAVVPLQLFAYYVSIGKGINPDMPRNLAKSVTVE